MTITVNILSYYRRNSAIGSTVTQPGGRGEQRRGFLSLEGRCAGRASFWLHVFLDVSSISDKQKSPLVALTMMFVIWRCISDEVSRRGVLVLEQRAVSKMDLVYIMLKAASSSRAFRNPSHRWAADRKIVLKTAITLPKASLKDLLLIAKCVIWMSLLR